MKKYLFIISILLLLTSCKTTSNIVTSKEEAVKKGIYTKPVATNTTIPKVKKPQKEYTGKQVVAQTSKPVKTSVLNEQDATDIVIEEGESNYLIEQLINAASDNLGVGYRGGGTTKAGFDCSGLMYSTFKKFDITLPRSSYEMAEVGTPVSINSAKKGDLIFFINRGQHRINHVGMIVEVNGDDIKFIHSSTQSGVIISSLKESYYDRTFKQINRVIQ